MPYNYFKLFTVFPYIPPLGGKRIAGFTLTWTFLLILMFFEFFSILSGVHMGGFSDCVMLLEPFVFLAAC